MKAKKGFNLRTVCGENIIVAEGKENIDFSNIISMNESSAYLWKNIQEKESFTAEDLAKLLTEEYDVDEDTALADAETLAAQWVQAGICE
ncbi:MAG: PqqD family protein [Prevotella sp.]|nr:PqqD family protein [Prevotella sp.]